MPQLLERRGWIAGKFPEIGDEAFNVSPTELAAEWGLGESPAGFDEHTKANREGIAQEAPTLRPATGSGLERSA
jgi:hypothetical protein